MQYKKKHRLRVAGMAVVLFLLFTWCYGYYVGRFRYHVHNQDISFYDLPQEFDGYRIVHFSDLHVGSFSNGHEIEVQKIVDLIRQQKPDVVVFTGDIVNRTADELKDYRHMLSELSAPDGVYSILGNHDYGIYMRSFSEEQQKAEKQKVVDHMREYGWTPLLNQNVAIQRGNAHIYIIGVENQGYLKSYFPRHADMDKAMHGVGKQEFKVLLSHDPTHWRHDIVGKTNIQLTLSGHTHAGQFEMFGWSPVSFAYPEWKGIYVEDAQVLNISAGVGSLIPFRFGSSPEINVITLHRVR